MHKVLVFGITSNPGGVEAVIMNYYRNIDRSKIQFDFLCKSPAPAAFADEIESLGGHIYYFTSRTDNYRAYRSELNAFFEEHAHDYSSFWMNECGLANIDYIKLAKKHGIKKRIIHSHNSRNMYGKLQGFLHSLHKQQIAKYATDFWACSKEAGEWFFPSKIKDKVLLINNGIDVGRYAFDEEKRVYWRKKYSLEDAYVIGNVGRLHFQKNQEFLLEVFTEVLRMQPNCRLVLIGQGEDEEKLHQKAKALGIEAQVLFAGVQSDIPGWLSAFDLFVFPSVFEGLSVVALEAQANGLPVLASEGVLPSEGRINDNFRFYSLSEDVKSWAAQILNMSQNEARYTAEDIKENFRKAGFDIKTEAVKLQERL